MRRIGKNHNLLLVMLFIFSFIYSYTFKYDNYELNTYSESTLILQNKKEIRDVKIIFIDSLDICFSIDDINFSINKKFVKSISEKYSDMEPFPVALIKNLFIFEDENFWYIKDNSQNINVMFNDSFYNYKNEYTHINKDMIMLKKKESSYQHSEIENEYFKNLTEMNAFKMYDLFKTLKKEYIKVTDNTNFILISSVSSINSAGGVDPKLTFLNLSNKRIKYLYPSLVAYNRVGDLVSCSVRDRTTFNGQVTGFIEPNSNDFYEWDCAWYANDTEKVKVTSFKIVLSNGKTEIYNRKSVNVIFKEKRR